MSEPVLLSSELVAPEGGYRTQGLLPCGAVNTDLLDCDYYRFQELDAGAVNAYETEYMSQYPWADFLYNGY